MKAARILVVTRFSFSSLFALVGLVAVGCGPTPQVPEGDCTSQDYWLDGDEESPRMHPGGDCIECHARGEGPNFTLAGTVMGGSTDVTDCNGVGDVTVDIIDKNGAVALTLTSNAAGNFYSNGGLATELLPYTVRLTQGGNTREMATPQTEQNCMSCHSADGANGAPGRILAP